MAITPLPTAPSRADPTNFSARADDFMTALPTFASECNATAVAMTLNATNATSTTSLLIGLGSKSLTVQTAKSYVVGMTVKIASTASPTNWMLGDVTAYTTGTGALVVNVIYTGGTGTIAAWTLSQSVAATGDATLTSINGGQLAGMRNRIINGGMQVAQRGGVALTLGVGVYGGCDRTFMLPLAFTTATGSLLRGSSLGSGFSSSGYLQAAVVTTTGSGLVRFGQKIEAANCVDLNGKTITIQCVLLQDTGAALNANISVYKAGSVDSWSAPTLVGTSTNFSVAGNGLTKTNANYTLTLGAADATNGLMVLVDYTGVGAVTAKSFYIGELQLEIGSVATPFEQRPYGMELALCQRYYCKSNTNGAGNGNTFFGMPIPVNAFLVLGLGKFPVTMRIVPSVTGFDDGGTVGKFSQPGLADNLAYTNITGLGLDGFSIITATVAATIGSPVRMAYTASAEL